MISFKQYNDLILESYKDAKRIFLQQYNTNRESWGQSPKSMDEFTEQFDNLINDFKRLQTANILSGKEKDISYWISQGYNEFVKMIHSKLKEYRKKKELQVKSKDAVVVFKNENATVYNIKSYEASCKYGAGTKWCITSADTREHWDSYTKAGINFYFIIPSSSFAWDDSEYGTKYLEKIAVAVHPMSQMEVFNVLDNQIPVPTFHKIVDQLGIPQDTFKPNVLSDKQILQGQLYNCRMPDNFPNTMKNHEIWEDMWRVQAAISYALNFNNTYEEYKRFLEKPVEVFSDSYYMIQFWSDGSSIVANLDDYDADQYEFVFKDLNDYWEYFNKYEITPQKSIIDAMEYVCKKLGKENKWSRFVGEKPKPVQVFEDGKNTIKFYPDKSLELIIHDAFNDETIEYEHFSRFVAEYEDSDYSAQTKAIKKALEYFTSMATYYPDLFK